MSRFGQKFWVKTKYATAVAAPTIDNLTTALAEDPLLTHVDAKPPARALCRYAQREDSASWTSV